MTKNLSIISMLAMVFFITTSFTTSKLQTAAAETDKFGFPFAFFKPAPIGAATSQMSFSLVGIIGDLAIWFSLAFALVFLFTSLFKFEKSRAL